VVLRRLRATPEEVPSTSGDAARLAALAEIVRVLGRTNDYDALLVDSARAARRALDGASISVGRWERGLGQVRVLVNEGDLAAWEVERPADEVYSVRRDPALTELMVRGEGYVVVLGERGDPSSLAVLFETNKSSALDVPIVVEGKVWGDLWVSRDATQEPYSEADLDYATIVAAQVGAAIAAGERLAKISRLAYTDPLTGLANRRAVDERLDAALEAHDVEGIPVSLLVCDVNSLKLINDERGHEAGDRALIQLAGLLSASSGLAPGSLAARLGGDEFCVVMDGHSGDVAVQVAEDLTRRAAELLPQGVSCGVASTDDDVGIVRSPGRLFRLADAAQYRAKRGGSKQPVVAGRSLASQAATDAALTDPDSAAHGLGRGSGHGNGSTGNEGEPHGDRRQVRGKAHVDSGRIIEVGVAAFDETKDRGEQDGLERMAEVICQLVDAAGWWISVSPPLAKVVRTVGCAVYRTAPPESGRDAITTSEVGTEYLLGSFPVTRSALAGQARLVSIEDPYADPAESAIIDGLGCVELLIGGGESPSGDRWLVEIFGDELSSTMKSVVSPLRALIALALAPRSQV
jgi:diguanylate cyclase (GGDEF)-like protein